MSYEVCITIMEPYRPEVRLPAVETQAVADKLAQAARVAYPDALIEIAHDGLRAVVSRKKRVPNRKPRSPGRVITAEEFARDAELLKRAKERK